jgi:hypothetical protein
LAALCMAGSGWTVGCDEADWWSGTASWLATFNIQCSISPKAEVLH